MSDKIFGILSLFLGGTILGLGLAVALTVGNPLVTVLAGYNGIVGLTGGSLVLNKLTR